MSRRLRWAAVRSLKVGFVGASAVALGFAASGATASFDGQAIGELLVPLALTVLALATQVICLAFAWHLLLCIVTRSRVSMATSTATFIAGWVARYLPGPPTGPAGKLLAGRGLRLSPGAMAAALYYEQILQLAAMVLLPGIVAWAWLGPAAAWLALPAALAALALLGVAAKASWTRRLGRLAERAGLRGAGLIEPLGARSLLLPLLFMLAAGAFAGVAFHILASATTGWPEERVASGLFLFGLASLAGFLTPLAPSGAGVREAILVATLGPVIGPREALGVALLFRAVGVVLDAAIAATAAIAYGGRPVLRLAARGVALVKKRA